MLPESRLQASNASGLMVAAQLFQLSYAMAETQPASRGLVVLMHQTKASLSASLMRAQLKQGRTMAVVNANTGNLREQLQGLTKANMRFERIVSAFELHHAPNIVEVMRQMHDLLTQDGLLLFADYAFADADPESIRATVDSSAEQKQIDTYGNFQRWFSAHQQFSTEKASAIVREAGFPHIDARALPGNRVCVLAGDRPYGLS